LKINNQAGQIRKDDSHLWQLVEELKNERKLAGITEQPFNLNRANALWEEYKTLSALEGSRYYLIFIEPTYPEDGFIACCPAVGNCTATAPTREQAKKVLIDEIYRRLKEIDKKEQPLPTEQGTVEIVEISAKQLS
jgi:predicted RNase H-like HicB family nuclease